MINILENEKTFLLSTKETSMIFHVLESGHLVELYYGDRIEDNAFSYIIKDLKHASYLSDTDGIEGFKLEQMPLAYPAYGNPDLRTPAFMFEYDDGSRITDLRFDHYTCSKEKKKIKGLPTTLGPCEVITFVLTDQIRDLQVSLNISIFEQWDVFTQSVEVSNKSASTIKINSITSACLSLLEDNFQIVSLTGAWGRERMIRNSSLTQGRFLIDSKRGATGHGQSPFIALTDQNVTEDHGRIYAMNLVYSGNFKCEVEVDMHQNVRMMCGLNDFDFEWSLATQETFMTPEAVLVYARGYTQMTHRFHDFYRDCLIPRSFVHQERPVLINNWEATYFDFDGEKLRHIASEAANLGIELFVLDDGWYGQRNDIYTSLGDWQPNEKKLGQPLKQFVQEIHQQGMKFGLWFEPEMVSPQSQLFKQHPDWIIRVPFHKPQLARHQYVLDLSREEVQAFIIESISTIIRDHQVDYVKWDMNRNITDSGSFFLDHKHQKELPHRYMLGLYHVLDVLTATFPNVLFEGCAGGGGRFDPGMLKYFPQIWTSDDTDAIERLSIQKGTSLLYPCATMGAHVSAVPNHQMGRITPLKTRGVVAMMGDLGYELDITQLSKKQKDEIKQQIRFYKSIRHLITDGDYYRLENGWMFVSRDQKEALVSHVQILSQPNTVPKRLHLKGLDAASFYQIDNTIISGSALMHIGLALDQAKEDFHAQQWVIRKVENYGD